MYGYAEHRPSPYTNPPRRIAVAGRAASRSWCPACKTSDSQLICWLPQVPVNCSALLPTRPAARQCATGSIELRACNGCGLAFNAQFDADAVKYDTKYDNSLDFSPAFQTYVRGLAEYLVDAYSLHGKRVVEIGCGQGAFLKLLCNVGNNTGKGFDPSFPGDFDPAPGVGFVKDYFGQADATEGFDFLCCRHVLEHIERPLEFLLQLSGQRKAGAGATFYFEVPNAGFVLGGEGFWDVIYPHISYFTEASLRALFERAGFEVLKAGKRFSNQFLFIEARLRQPVQKKHPSGTDKAIGLSDELISFTTQFASAVRDWSACLGRFSAARKRIAFWGAGAKGVTFLNLVPGARNIVSVIDSNLRKQQMFVPGTGQRISPPETLREFAPHAVILLNPAYRQEISALLATHGVQAGIITQPNILL
jgi:SAM-dependent methyltransferase